MDIKLKATHTKLTPAVRGRVERICAQLEKLAHSADSGALECAVEVGKTTEHHRRGNVFCAEINFTAGGEYFRAVAEGETELAALDAARDEITHELAHAKHKEQSRIREDGARMKDSTWQTESGLDE